MSMTSMLMLLTAEMPVSPTHVSHNQHVDHRIYGLKRVSTA